MPTQFDDVVRSCFPRARSREQIPRLGVGAQTEDEAVPPSPAIEGFPDDR
jgi:hypothetical protein